MTDMNNSNSVSSAVLYQDSKAILNSKTADSSSKIIFEDPILCSQFLRDYIDLPYMKDVRPEDIEDVSEQFIPLFAEERNADRVKKVNIGKENPFFLISLIEHKSKVDYNVCMQIFRYMVYIWEAYAREAEKMHKGITKQAGFRYPPILPVVYYEGAGKWTVPLDFKSRIIEGDTFGKFIPDFEYYLIPLRQYSNEELLAKRDEISLVMMINRMQNIADIEEFRKLSTQKVDEILKDTPEHILDIISNILRTFLLKMNLPEEKTEELVGKVKDKKMGYLFENMDRIDIQAEWRKMDAVWRKLDEKSQELDEKSQELNEKSQELNEKSLELDEKSQRLSVAEQEIAEERRRLAEETLRMIRLMIETCQELGMHKESVRQKICESFDLTEERANSEMALYWREER